MYILKTKFIKIFRKHFFIRKRYNFTKKIQDLINVIRRIIDLVDIPNLDVAWTHYETGADLISELKQLVYELEQGNKSVLEQVDFLFAPTGTLQEISISNGWGELFIEISSEVDEIINDIKEVSS